MNTNNNRRALLGAIAGAPLLAAAGVASAISPAADLAALDEAGLLELGSRNADAEFARLCGAAFEATARANAASRLYGDASDAAERATPAYPEGLRYSCRYTHTKGERAGQVDTWTETCEPDGVRASMLWNMAHRRAKAAGVSYSVAEAQLRAEYAAWRAAKDAARAHYMVAELAEADDAAWTVAGDALRRVRRYSVRTGDALLIKLRLHANEDGADFDATQWAALIADVERALGSIA